MLSEAVILLPAVQHLKAWGTLFTEHVLSNNTALRSLSLPVSSETNRGPSVPLILRGRMGPSWLFLLIPQSRR